MAATSCRPVTAARVLTLTSTKPANRALVQGRGLARDPSLLYGLRRREQITEGGEQQRLQPGPSSPRCQELQSLQTQPNLTRYREFPDRPAFPAYAAMAAVAGSRRKCGEPLACVSGERRRAGTNTLLRQPPRQLTGNGRCPGDTSLAQASRVGSQRKHRRRNVRSREDTQN